MLLNPYNLNNNLNHPHITGSKTFSSSPNSGLTTHFNHIIYKKKKKKKKLNKQNHLFDATAYKIQNHQQLYHRKN